MLLIAVSGDEEVRCHQITCSRALYLGAVLNPGSMSEWMPSNQVAAMRIGTQEQAKRKSS